jgi:hypothetical protein
MSRTRILTLSLVAAITLGCGASAQGGPLRGSPQRSFGSTISRNTVTCRRTSTRDASLRSYHLSIKTDPTATVE